jgi:hypothetical protein
MGGILPTLAVAIRNRDKQHADLIDMNVSKQLEPQDLSLRYCSNDRRKLRVGLEPNFSCFSDLSALLWRLSSASQYYHQKNNMTRR